MVTGEVGVENAANYSLLATVPLLFGAVCVRSYSRAGPGVSGGDQGRPAIYTFVYRGSVALTRGVDVPHPATTSVLPSHEHLNRTLLPSCPGSRSCLSAASRIRGEAAKLT